MEHMIKGQREDIRGMNDDGFNRTLMLEIMIETATSKIRNVGVSDELVSHYLDTWTNLMLPIQIVEYTIADKGEPETKKTPKHILDYYPQNK